jgi:imidazolonepropionase-like amidohydrolase
MRAIHPLSRPRSSRPESIHLPRSLNAGFSTQVRPMKATCKRIVSRFAACAALLAATSTATPANPASNLSEKLVIEAGRIITQAGPDILDGVIVIEGGRITAVGRADEVDKPWDAPVIGGPDLVAFPGFVEALTSSGMDRANENIDVAPFLDIADSIDPVAYFFEDCLRWGITTINIQQGNNCVVGGQGMIVRPVGLTIEEMVVRPRFGNKISIAPKGGKSRATQLQTLRRAFADLQLYLEGLVQKERDDAGRAAREALFQGRELEGEDAEGRPMSGTAWKVEGLEMIPRGAIDEKQTPLLEMVEGRRPVFLNCGAPMDVPQALEIARENGFLARTTLVIGPSCWKAADLIAEAGVPVILVGDLMHVRRDPVTGEELETFVPGVLEEKGIRFALCSRNASTNSLWYQAALAIGRGLDRQKALDAVTTIPAEVLGLGKEVGSIEEGKLGNVVLFSGDPLDVTSWAEHVVIEGNEVYDRSKDVRNRHLLDGVQPAGTGANVEDPAEHEEEDED